MNILSMKKSLIIFGSILSIVSCTYENKNPEIEHAVIVHFDYGIEEMTTFYQLRDKLENIIEREHY